MGKPKERGRAFTSKDGKIQTCVGFVQCAHCGNLMTVGGNKDKVREFCLKCMAPYCRASCADRCPCIKGGKHWQQRLRVE